MRRSVLLVLLVMCAASCVADSETAGDGAAGGSGAPPAPQGPFVGMSVAVIAEQLGVAAEPITDCHRGCLAFAREGCQHAMQECKGHEDDDGETACAGDGEGNEYVTPCPNALALACGGQIPQHECYTECQRQGRR